jgi:4'-phosphopantetheinyl transferase EntD
MGVEMTDPLTAAIASLAPPAIAVGHRTIAPGDEHALMPEEAGAFARSVVKVRRASGAARIVARELLARFGHAGRALPKGTTGAPVWPAGIVGSLSHDDEIAVAAAALSRDIAALGIDVEPAEPLPAELVDIVVTPRERLRFADDPYGGRLIFAAKEAVYKAVHPLDRTFLDHHDVEIDVAECRAVVCNGRQLALRFGLSTHLVVLAFITAQP